MGQSNPDWEVVVLDDLDTHSLQLVSDFFNEQFPGVFYPECTPDVFKWKLGPNNPAGSGFLTVAMNNGVVIGTASGTRKILASNNQSISAIEIGDTFTHPNFRKNGRCLTELTNTTEIDSYFTRSIFGRLVSETITRARLAGVEYIYGTPNENSKPPYLKRLKFKEIDNGKLNSNVILTNQNAFLHKIRPLVILSTKFSQIYTCALSYLVFGKNSLLEITAEDFLDFCSQEFLVVHDKEDGIYLKRTPEILKHRYVKHPSYNYRFFQIAVKDVVKGVLITCEVVRSSGVSSHVVSDWLISDKRIEKKITFFISKLRLFSQNSEIISFWDFGGPSKLTKFFHGIIVRQKISLISRDFINSSGQNVAEFGDFHMGWSDNG
jgi:hypothetical protein